MQRLRLMVEAIEEVKARVQDAISCENKFEEHHLMGNLIALEASLVHEVTRFLDEQDKSNAA